MAGMIDTKGYGSIEVFYEEDLDYPPIYISVPDMVWLDIKEALGLIEMFQRVIDEASALRNIPVDE